MKRLRQGQLRNIMDACDDLSKLRELFRQLGWTEVNNRMAVAINIIRPNAWALHDLPKKKRGKR